MAATSITESPITESPLELVQRLAPLIREHVASSEAGATLADPVVEALIETGLIKQLAPTSLGGREPDPVEWFRTVEAVARIDGSVGWCLFINGVTGIIGRALDERDAEEIVGNPRTVVAGAVFPFNKALAVDGGYRVSGRWPFASGCKHATHLIAFCALHDETGPRPGPMGGRDIRIMLFPASSARIIDTWDVMGLAGTGSHDFELDDVFVPEELAISLVPGTPNRHYTGPLYRLPFGALFAWPMAAVALGIAQHAIDIVTELAESKVPAGPGATSLGQRPLFHHQLADATAGVRSARAWLHEAIGTLWEIAQSDAHAELPDRANAQLAASNATRAARAATDLMFLAAGGTAVYRKSELERCLRDIHTLSQHAATSPSSWENAGAILAGQQPLNPLILL